MSHFDRYETRSPQSREAAQFRDLRAILAGARTRAPALRAQLRGLDVASLRKCADLACIPVVRRADLERARKELPPLGGFVAARPAVLKRLLPSPEGIVPEAHSKDFWGAARALHAAGLRKGDLLVNCFDHDGGVHAHMIDAGAAEIGCATVPLGSGDFNERLELLDRLKPSACCGQPDRLSALVPMLAGAGIGVRCAIAVGFAAEPSERLQFAGLGVAFRQIFAEEHLGVVAYETEADGVPVPGMMVNEGMIVEIVHPGTGDPVAAGEIGEVVVTRLKPEFPLLRFCTGRLSKMLAEPSPCGRTNVRIAGHLGDAEQATKIAGRLVRPDHLRQVGQRHPELGRMRLVVTKERGMDKVVLMAEGRSDGTAHVAQIAATLRAVIGLRGEVQFVAPGRLPKDGRVIADERQVG